MFTIDFKSLYTNIPVEDAIYLIKEVVLEFDDVVPNEKNVVQLINIILKNTFNGEYFQQIFGVSNNGNTCGAYPR